MGRIYVGGGSGAVDTGAQSAQGVPYTPAVPGNWPIPPTQVAQALDELAAAESAAQAVTFVYRPGGVSGKNVYADWPSLYAALNAAAPVSAQGNRPPTILQIDDSIVSPAVVPAGSYDLDSVQFTCVPNFANPDTGGALLHFADGTTISANTLSFNDALTTMSLNTAAPLITRSTPGAQMSVFLQDDAEIISATAQPFLSCTAGAATVRSINGSIGDGTHTVLAASGTGTVILLAYAVSFVEANAVSNGGSTAIIVWDTLVPTSPQGAGVTIIAAAYNSLAGASFVYQPGGSTAGNVYATWPELYAAIQIVQGARTIQIDDSITSPAVIPANATPYNLNGCTFVGVANETTNTGVARLDIHDGAKIAPGGNIFFQAIEVHYLGTAATCITNSGATQETNVFLSAGSALESDAGGLFLDVTNGFGALVTEFGALGDGTHVLASATAPGILNVLAYVNAFVFAGALTGGAQTRLFWDNNPPGAQGVGVAVTQVDGYVPATPANWSPAPTSQSTALDQLAAARTSAWADNQGPFGAIAATPNWSAFLVVSNFTVSTPKTATAITALWSNGSAASHTVKMGVAAVAHGALAPAAPDYFFAPTAPTVAAHATITYPLNVMYGAGGDAPAALAAGAYDFYVMVQADAALVILGDGMQMEVRNA